MGKPQPHHPHRRQIHGFGYFKKLGPGLITGAADDDPSGIGTYSQVGAAFGYGLLWTSVITLPLASAVQETTGRLALQTGKGLSALIRERFPRPILYVAVFLVCVTNIVNLGADLGAMAAAAHLIIPVPQLLLLVLMTALVLGLEVLMPYRRYARVLRWLCLSLLAYILVIFFADPDWREVLLRTFVPHMESSQAYLGAIIALLGTTISPYLFFWQAAQEVEEEEAHQEVAPVDEEHVKAMRIDTFSGMFSAVAVMWAIMVASGATLHARGITDVSTAVQAAQALEPLAGPSAGLIFALGIVGTGLLAVPVLAGSAGYALAEAFGRRAGLSKRFRQAPGFYLAIIAAMLVGFAINLTGINPIRALYFSAILNGIVAPPLILMLMILANSRKIIGNRRSGWLSNTLVGTTLVLMTALPLIYLLG